MKTCVWQAGGNVVDGCLFRLVARLEVMPAAEKQGQRARDPALGTRASCPHCLSLGQPADPPLIHRPAQVMTSRLPVIEHDPNRNSKSKHN